MTQLDLHYNDSLVNGLGMGIMTEEVGSFWREM